MDDPADLALSFGRAADAYDAVRPGYPHDALAWVLPANAATVLDLGAGTGKFTRLLVDAGRDVIAVEPDAAMLARLTASMPHVRALVGSAERIPVQDAAVDAVISAQAWHWVDRDRALPEVARVLRPGGTFGLLWNVLDGSVGWIRAIGAATDGRAGGGFDEITELSADFGPVESITVPWTYEVDRATLLRLVSSWSVFITASAERQASMLADVINVLDADPAVAGLDVYPLSYNTRCFRSRRQ